MGPRPSVASLHFGWMYEETRKIFFHSFASLKSEVDEASTTYIPGQLPRNGVFTFDGVFAAGRQEEVFEEWACYRHLQIMMGKKSSGLQHSETLWLGVSCWSLWITSRMWDFVSKLMGGIHQECRDLVQSTVDGHNVTIFAYEKPAEDVGDRRSWEETTKCLLFIAVFNLIDLIVTDGIVLFAVVLDPNSFNALTPMPASTEHWSTVFCSHLMMDTCF